MIRAHVLDRGWSVAQRSDFPWFVRFSRIKDDKNGQPRRGSDEFMFFHSRAGMECWCAQTLESVWIKEGKVRPLPLPSIRPAPGKVAG